MLQNLTRHLLAAGHIAELWGIVLDPNWVRAQWDAEEGKAAVKRDLMDLQRSTRASAPYVVDSVQHISRCIEASSSESLVSAQALSFSLLYRIFGESRYNSVVRLIRDKIVSSSPKPCLVPVISSFIPAHPALEAEKNFNVLGNTKGSSLCSRQKQEPISKN